MSRDRHLLAPRQRRHRLIQLLRRGVQLSATVLVLVLVVLSLYYHYWAAHALVGIESLEGWRGVVLSLVDTAVSGLSDPRGFLEGYNGSLWSMRLAGLEISDPLAFAEAAAASRTLPLGLLCSALIPVALTVIFGRVFCSWICPGYLLFEAAGKLRGLLGRAGLEAPEAAFAHRNKYVFLVVGLLVSAAVGLPIFSLFYPPALLSRIAHAVVFGSGVIGMVTILALMVAFEVLVLPRWWCRSMCPGGALYGLLGARRLLRVGLDKGCSNCGLCHLACEEGLHVMKQSRSIECDNCGACIRDCPEGVLRFSFERPCNGTGARVSSAATLAAAVAARGERRGQGTDC